MIDYMPFTFLPDALIGPLTRAVGPVAVLQPLETMATPAMQQASAQGLLHLRPCPGLDAAMLQSAVKGYTDWAAQHQGRSGDLTGVFKAKEVLGTQSLEESPNRIKTQVRRGVVSPPEQAADPMVQAALFLSLAHEYDGQKDALSNDLEAVDHMQQRFAQILGATPVDRAGLRTPQGSSAEGLSIDRGQYMTQRRVQAWARLAIALEDVGSLVLTTSQAVWEHLNDALADGVHLGTWALGPCPAGQSPPSRLSIDDVQAMIAQMTRSSNPQREDYLKTGGSMEAATGATLTLTAVPGCPPRSMLARFLNLQPANHPRVSEKAPPPNTLIGHISF